ncbi:response regulator receiver domain protein [delta proteobacterium NaphS2]|nr:response regulator receiver domain protein [delta proteobacterium NaphS2]
MDKIVGFENNAKKKSVFADFLYGWLRIPFPNVHHIKKPYGNEEKGYVMNNVYILEPDREFALMLQDELEYSGYSVDIYDQSSLLLRGISRENPDLVILDMDYDNYDALDLLQKLRNFYYDLPVILWSWNSDQKDDLRAIAADYIVAKQADLNELKTRMRMSLDSLWSLQPAAMTFGCQGLGGKRWKIQTRGIGSGNGAQNKRIQGEDRTWRDN